MQRMNREAQHNRTKKRTRTTILTAMIFLFLFLTGCGRVQGSPEDTINSGVQQEEKYRESIVSAPASEDVLADSKQTISSQTQSSETILDQVDSGFPIEFEDTRENVAAVKAFQEFLEGTRGVVIEDEEIPILSGNEAKEYLLTEILQLVTDTYFASSEDKTQLKRLQYTYLDLGADGTVDLALQFSGLDLYSNVDDSALVAVIVYEENELYLRSSFETWARSESELYYNGYRVSYGSSGAGIHHMEESFIDFEGREEIIYSVEIVSGWWARDLEPEAYEEVFGDEDVEELELSTYIMGDKQYITYIIGEDERYQTFISTCVKQGTLFSTQDEVEAFLLKRKSELGLDERIINTRECLWQEVNNPLFESYLQL